MNSLYLYSERNLTVDSFNNGDPIDNNQLSGHVGAGNTQKPLVQLESMPEQKSFQLKGFHFVDSDVFCLTDFCSISSKSIGTPVNNCYVP